MIKPPRKPSKRRKNSKRSHRDSASKSISSNKENFLPNVSQITPSNTSTYSMTSSPIEVYHSMQGFQKPRICKYSLPITSASCGHSHLWFLTSWGHLYSMGSNSHGQLGLCSLTLSHSTVPSLVDLPISPDEKVLQVSWGTSSTAAVVTGGKVYLWGEINGEPSPTLIEEFCRYGVQVQRVSWGREVVGYLTTGGEVFLGRRGGVELVGVPEKAIDVKWGGSTGVVLTEWGFVYEVGDGARKVKELETEFVVKVDWNGYWAAVTDEGQLYVWGKSVMGDFDRPERIKWIPKRVVDVSIGTDVGGWIDSSGMIWVWGKNENGELGVGDCKEKNTPYPVMALKTKKVTSLSWGGSFYVAIGSTITLKSPLQNNISQSKV